MRPRPVAAGAGHERAWSPEDNTSSVLEVNAAADATSPRPAAALCRVVEDDPEGVAVPGPDPTHAVTEIDAVRAARALDRPVVHCKHHRVTLTQRHDLDSP